MKKIKSMIIVAIIVSFAASSIGLGAGWTSTGIINGLAIRATIFLGWVGLLMGAFFGFMMGED
jgi:hypothetical protein